MKMNVCIKGVGCDTVSIPRFEEKMNNTRLVDKLFTEYEQNYIADKQIPSAAGIWAAKEAASLLLLSNFSKFYRNRNFFIFICLNIKLDYIPCGQRIWLCKKELL